MARLKLITTLFLVIFALSSSVVFYGESSSAAAVSPTSGPLFNLAPLSPQNLREPSLSRLLAALAEDFDASWREDESMRRLGVLAAEILDTDSFAHCTTDLQRGIAVARHLNSPEGIAMVTGTQGTSPDYFYLTPVLRNRRASAQGLGLVFLCLADQLGLDTTPFKKTEGISIFVQDGPRLLRIDCTDRGLLYEVQPGDLGLEHVSSGIPMVAGSEISAFTWAAHAMQLAASGRMRAAQEAAGQALQLDASAVEAEFVLGWIWMCHGGYEKAVRHFSEVIRQDPYYAPAYSLRGLALSNLGRFKQALSDSFRAKALRPDNRVYLENQAAIYEALGQSNRALLTRKRSL
ncbi:MAG: tetratricopeptide repeat protein [Candidatus Omnitrophica bacterium]|nr:tetratricopeptide repeat protein [Candidatus Omnitrophota bacterium]